MVKKLMLLVATAALFASCTDKNAILLDQVSDITLLGITTGISVQGGTRAGFNSGVVTGTGFKDQTTIGICVFGDQFTPYPGGQPHVNIPVSTINGASWAFQGDPFWIGSEVGSVYAYFPYDERLDQTTFNYEAIPVAAGETDHMWGSGGKVSFRSSQANISLNHALAQITFKVALVDFEGVSLDGSARLTEVRIEDANGLVAQNGTMNIADGKITNTTDSERLGSFKVFESEENPLLLHKLSTTPVEVVALMLPISTTKTENRAESVVFVFKIDGVEYKQTVALYATRAAMQEQVYNWSAGDNYVYNISLTGKGLNIGTVTVEPWNEVFGGNIELN